MVRAWWLIVAFVAGGWMGMLIMAIMAMAGRQSEHEHELEEARTRFKKEYLKWS